ncbi:MAG: carbamoyl-phosphate synthase small subunit [Alphaproteobacteria bacterium]|nr:MAG: carbamoyl-phosphate synthase small subunit [Alphaproteobacteria bacterium]
MTDAPQSLSAGPTFSDSQNRFSAVLVLEDGTVWRGHGVGASGEAVGELCFNTAMTGYQEILSDPSYAGQIVTFTFPHIGNVGVNPQDMEAARAAALGFVVREPVSVPSNWRATDDFAAWAAGEGLIGIWGVDTRRLTRHLRAHGFLNGIIAHDAQGRFDLAALWEKAKAFPGLVGAELAAAVSTSAAYETDEGLWRWEQGGFEVRSQPGAPAPHVVVVDFGVKRNILRNLVSAGARVSVVPAKTPAERILAMRPAAVVLSNGPGDPAASAAYAVPMIRALIAAGTPILGICLGHQLLALALGGRTEKMHQGHHGANHPVQDLETGKVSIVSMNHGFTVVAESLDPELVRVRQVSLFDASLCAFEGRKQPLLGLQQHPEASPGPQDSFALFAEFLQRAGEWNRTRNRRTGPPASDQPPA